MRSNIMIFALGGFLCCFSLSSLQAHFCIVSILPNSDERGGHLIFFVLHVLVLHVSDLFLCSLRIHPATCFCFVRDTVIRTCRHPFRLVQWRKYPCENFCFLHPTVCTAFAQALSSNDRRPQERSSGRNGRGLGAHPRAHSLRDIV